MFRDRKNIARHDITIVVGGNENEEALVDTLYEEYDACESKNYIPHKDQGTTEIFASPALPFISFFGEDQDNRSEKMLLFPKFYQAVKKIASVENKFPLIVYYNDMMRTKEHCKRPQVHSTPCACQQQ
jgi:hypothetical protein